MKRPKKFLPDKMDKAVELRSLKERPFELLLEMERRSLAAIAGQATDSGSGQEWVGIAFRMGEEQFVAPRDETREVLPYPEHITRVPGAKNWVKGLANIRGQLLPIIDLKALLGGGITGPARQARVLVVNDRDIPAGLAVDEVLGFRRFVESEHVDNWPPTVIRSERYVSGAFRRGAETWPVFSLRLLMESDTFLNAAEP